MASERRNGGISSRQKARRRLPYLTYMPTLSMARFVASKTMAATAPATRSPTDTVVRDASKKRAAASKASDAKKAAVSYTHLRAHETDSYLVCRLLLEKK